METRMTTQGTKYNILSSDEVFDILDSLQNRVDKTILVLCHQGVDTRGRRALTSYNTRLDNIRQYIIEDDSDVYYIRSDNLNSLNSWNTEGVRFDSFGPIPEIIRQVQMPENFLDRYSSIYFDSEKDEIVPIPLSDKDKNYINESFRFFIEITGSSSNEGDCIRIYDILAGSTRDIHYDKSLIRILYEELVALLFGYRLDTLDIKELEAIFNNTNTVSYYQKCILDNEYFGLINSHIRPLVKKGILRKCTSCNKMYIMTLNEYEWYKDKKLNIPKRCKACRYARKASKK